MSEENVDDFTKRARRRLVGAVVMALTAVILLPMVMDQPPPSAGNDIKISIPEQKPMGAVSEASDRPGITVQEVAPPPASDAPASVPPVSVAAAPVSPASPSPKESIAAPEPVVVPPVKKEEPKEPASRPESTRPEPAKPKEPPAVASRDERSHDAQRAAAILAGQTSGSASATNAPDAGRPHIIQIGAYASAANVKTIQNKLNEIGVRSYTEEIDSPQGKKTRVRAGPFPNREAAEKAHDKMKRIINLSGVVAAKP